MLRNVLGTGSVLRSIGNILLEQIMLPYPSLLVRSKNVFRKMLSTRYRPSALKASNILIELFLVTTVGPLGNSALSRQLFS